MITGSNLGELKKRVMKLAKPTQGLPSMPKAGEYCRKAICAPYIGA